MTETTFEALRGFLVKFQPSFFSEMRIADYGGTDSVGYNQVQKLLKAGGLENYHMLDFDNGIDLRKPIKGKKYDLGICMDLLEHTNNPLLVAKNIRKSMNKGAYLFVTVPFSWPIHGFPDDFWRFTPSGIQELFRGEEILYCEVIRDTYSPEEEYRKLMENEPAMVPTPYSRIIAAFKIK